LVIPSKENTLAKIRNRPAIVAEGLAQAAVHDNWMVNFYLSAEKAAAENSSSPSPSIIQLLNDIRADKKLNTAVKWDSGEDKIRDGLMSRAPEETIKFVSSWSLDKTGGEKELEKRTAEMMQAALYYTAGAQKPPKQVKFDFFFM